MVKAEHMMSSMTMDRMTEYQQEYIELRAKSNSHWHEDRISLLEVIFDKIDTGKILIEESV